MTRALVLGILRVLLGLVLLAMPSLARAQCASGTYPCGSEYCTPNDGVCCASVGNPQSYCPSGYTCVAGGGCEAPGGSSGTSGSSGGTCPSGRYACPGENSCCPSGTVCGTGTNGCGADSCCDPNATSSSGGTTSGGTPTCSAGLFLCASGDGCCPTGTTCGTGTNGCGVDYCCDPSTGQPTANRGDTVPGGTTSGGTTSGGTTSGGTTSGGTTSGGTSGSSTSSSDGSCLDDAAPDGCSSKQLCCGNGSCWVAVDGERFTCSGADCIGAGGLADDYCSSNAACAVTPRTPPGSSHGAAALPLLGALVVLGRRRGSWLARGGAVGVCAVLALLLSL